MIAVTLRSDVPACGYGCDHKPILCDRYHIPGSLPSATLLPSSQALQLNVSGRRRSPNRRGRLRDPKMSVNIGLDIGAVSLKLAAIGAPGDAELFQSLAERKRDGFFLGCFPAASSW